jgi:phosphoketolase
MPTFVSTRPCELVDHGNGPMSIIVRDDAYGQQPLSVVHSEPETALEHAINLVKDRDFALAVAVVSESEFEDPDRFDFHRGALLSPLRDGVVLAVIHAPLHAKENLDDETAREDLLRAAGYAAYTLDLSREEDARHLHKRMAALLEDIFDEITQIKADGEARVSSYQPLWPLVEMRSTTPLP